MKTTQFIPGGLIAAIVAMASSAFAVSQIGGGKCFDPSQGYSARLPKAFVQGSSNGHGVIQLFGRDFRQGLWSGGIGYEELVIEDLTVANPLAAEISNRDVFIAHWLGLGWSVEETQDPCLVIVTKDESTSHDAILAWGQGRGIELVGPLNPTGKAAITEFIGNLQLESGACTWK